MKRTASVQTLVLTTLLGLLVPSVLGVSVFFYRQFKASLNERVFLQLSSIRTLKKAQLENYLEELWQNAEGTPSTSTKNTGWHDISEEKGAFTLLKCKDERCSEIKPLKINEILAQRTGMGQSGESYLVGKDKKLRTASRFFPNQNPLGIHCETLGSHQALLNKTGTAILKDYRGIEVYSAFELLENRGLRLAILSEIDSKEALKPIIKLQKLFLWSTLLILGGVFILSLFLAKLFTRPVLKMKEILDSLKKGKYDIDTSYQPRGREMALMFKSLHEVLEQFKETVRFSEDIGKMNLEATYRLYGEHDVLGQSLLRMKEQLKAFNALEGKRQLELRSAIITGQESERLRLSQELHDGIGPLLTYQRMKIDASKLEEQDKIILKSLIDQTIKEVRRMTFNLMPQSLKDFGLLKAMQQLVLMAKDLTSTNIHFVPQNSTGISELDADRSIGLFRVAQECLHNGIKHAEATEITLKLNNFENELEFIYEDNGKGFNLDQKNSGSGIKNIKSRVEVLNGKIKMFSHSKGTFFQVKIPK